jgi:holo-[acyl-carrier protein] synthase
VRAEEVEESLRIHGDRYLRRVYTEEELHDCGSNARRLAARFAAKEAAMKALGRADEGISWRSIAVERGATGSPSLKLTGAAADLARRRGVRELSVSITHQSSLVAAVVLAEI